MHLILTQTKKHSTNLSRQSKPLHIKIICCLETGWKLKKSLTSVNCCRLAAAVQIP